MANESSDFEARLNGAGLLTTEILYYMPDYPKLLQSFTWQTVDKAPEFARLSEFLDFWRREIEAVIHSIRIAHADYVGPSGWQNAKAFMRLN